MYDSPTSWFTQEAPIGLAGGLNLYGYANGDPVHFSDPFGLCPSCIGALGGALLGGGGRAVYHYLNDRPLSDGLLEWTVGGAVAGATLGVGYSALAARGATAAAAASGAGAAGGAAFQNGSRIQQLVETSKGSFESPRLPLMART